MGKDKGTLLWLLFLSNIVLAGLLFKNYKERALEPQTVGESVTEDQYVVSNQDDKSLNNDSGGSQNYKDKGFESDLKRADKLDDLVQKEAIDKNTHAKLKFSSLSQFRADFPDDFTYMLFEDMEDDLILLEGKLNEEDTYSATVATKAIINPENIIGVLKNNPDMLPGLADNLSWINDRIPPKKLTGPLPKGLEDVYFWRADSRNSKTAAFVYGVRNDKKGSYFFLVHGPTNYLENNEGKFDKFLSSIELIK